jgi:hypothetical protein
MSTVSMSTAWISGSLVAVATVWFIFSRQTSKKTDIPLVDLQGVKSPMRYVAETGRLMAKGYSEVRCHDPRARTSTPSTQVANVLLP